MSFRDDIQRRLEAKLSQLIEDGHSPDEIRAFAPKLREEVQAQIRDVDMTTAVSTPNGPRQITFPRPEGADDERGVHRALRQSGMSENDFRRAQSFGGDPRDRRGAELMLLSPEERQEAAGIVGGAVAGMGAGVAAGAALAPVAAAARTAGPVARVLARLGIGAAEGATGGAVEGATNAAITGRDVSDAASDGAWGGAAFGTGARLLADTAGGVSNLVRRDNWVGRFAKGREAGTYRKPEMADLPKGAKGVQEASEKGLQRITNRSQQLDVEATDAYGNAVNPRMAEPVDRDIIVNKLKQARAANLDPDTGLPLRDDVAGKLDTAIQRTAPRPTVAGSLARRRTLKREAAFKSPSPTPDQQASQDAYHAFRAGVRDASPEVAAADDAYTAYANKRERRNDILFNTEENVAAGSPLGETAPLIDAADELAEGVSPTMRVGKERAATAFLSRVGDENVPGLRAAKYIEELAGQDDEFRAAIDMIADKKAQELVRFSLMPNNIGNDLSSATFFKGLPRLAIQNARALGAHVVDPMATAMRDLTPPASIAGAARGANPLVEARRKERDREAERARKIKERRD